MWASAAAMTALAAVGPVAAATGVAGCAGRMKAAAREAASRARTPVLMSRNVLLTTRAPITGGDRRAAGWATSCIHDRQGLPWAHAQALVTREPRMGERIG